MTAGRKPKPARMKVIQGNPGKRALNQGEPKPPVGKPRCPSFLTGEAKAEWRRITSELDDMGLITKADRAALVLYCEAWSIWREASDQIAENGMTVESPNGMVMQSPYISIRNKAADQMRRILTEYGLTPSSRSRVTVPKVEEENPFEKFLDRKSA